MKPTQTRRHMRTFGLLLSALALGATTSSCVDGSLDLDKDWDNTVNFGGKHFAVPLGSTEKITLDKIIELDDDGDLQLNAQGEYHIIHQDNIEDATTEVEIVKIAQQTNDLDPIRAVNDTDTPDDQHFVIQSDIREVGNVEVTSYNIEEALKELGRLEPVRSVPVTLQLTVDGPLRYESLEADLVITFPKFFRFVEGDQNLSLNADDCYQLKLALHSSQLDDAGTYRYPLELREYLFGTQAGEGLVVNNGMAVVTGTATTIGTSRVKVYTTTLNPGDHLNIRPSVIMDPMDIKRVTGVIKPDIDQTTTSAEIASLPDFLENEETRLDITNPILTLKANNPLEKPVGVTGILVGFDKNGQKIANSEVTIGGPDAPIILQTGNNVFALSRLGEGGEAGAENIRVANLNNLMEKIPARIDVELTPTVLDGGEYYSVDLGRTYHVDGDYKLDVPLSFGGNLRIVYDETADGFNGDIEDLSLRSLNMTLDADNTIPLALEIKNENITPVDVDGNPLAGISVTVDGTIKESADGVSVASSKLTLELRETTEGAFSRLDGLHFSVTAVPGEARDVQLKSSQWVQLKTMSARIPGGITVDLN